MDLMTQDAARAGLPYSKTCFVCGEDNAAGLKTRFYVENDVVKAPLRPEPHHCGYENVVHGGVVAALLDECMGWAATRATNRMCFTGELTVRYLRPVPADRELTACAHVERAGKRLAYVRGWIEDAGGEVFARGEGRFTPLTVEQTLDVDGHLIYDEACERPFEGLRP